MSAQTEMRPHADRIEGIDETEQFRLGPNEPTEHLQPPQQPPNLLNFGPALSRDIGVEFVGADSLAILHTVAEFGINQLDAELPHQQYDKMVVGRNERSHRNIERYGRPVVLWNVDGDGIAE